MTVIQNFFDMYGVWGWLVVVILAIALSFVAVRTHRKNSVIMSTTLTDVTKQLYLALWNPLIDYSFKLFAGIKNLYYFPIGIDHRVFKRKYNRIVNNSGVASVQEVENDHPITPKANYHLLCMTVWAISIYIYWAVKNIIYTLYSPAGTDIFAKSLPIIIALATFLLDVWIVRSYGIMKQNPKWWVRPVVTLLRFGVSFCTASLAAFHLLSLAFAKDISQVSKKTNLAHISQSSEFRRLLNIRDQLAVAEYNSEGKRYCLNLLTKGRTKSDKSFIYPSSEFQRIYKTYQLPPEQQIDFNSTSKLNMESYDCSIIVRDDEPQCYAAWADKDSCPRFANNAKQAFIEDAGIFGLDFTLKRGWFDVEKSYPELLKLTDDPTNPPLKVQYDELKKQLFPPDAGKQVTTDISTAVLAIQEGMKQYQLSSIMLLMAPIFIIACFEFSVLIVKTIWGKSKADDYLSTLDSDTSNTIISNTITPFQESYLMLNSEFFIQDHIANILEIFRLAIQPLLTSKIFAAIIFLCLLFLLYKLIQIEIWTFFNAIYEILNNIIKLITKDILSEWGQTGGGSH